MVDALGGSALLAAHETMLERLRAELRRAVDSVLQPRPAGVALVDFPMHSNVGDLAIWAGELAVLSDLEVPAAYACDGGCPDRRGTSTAILS